MHPEPTPRSRMRRRSIRSGRTGKRRLDQRFRLRSGHEHARSNRERAAIELLGACEIGERLALAAARHQFAEQRCLHAGQFQMIVRQLFGPAHSGRQPDQEHRFPPRRIDAGRSQTRSGIREGGRDLGHPSCASLRA